MKRDTVRQIEQSRLGVFPDYFKPSKLLDDAIAKIREAQKAGNDSDADPLVIEAIARLVEYVELG